MTKNQLLQWHKRRVAGSGLPELGVISLEEEDQIRRSEGEEGLLAYEPDKEKLLSAGPAGRYVYERRYGGRPGTYTTADERMRLEMDKGPPMGSDWGWNDYVKSLRGRQLKAFKGEDPTAGMPRGPANLTQRGRRQVKKNPMVYPTSSGDQRETMTEQDHPLAGQAAGRYRLGDTIIAWDGTQEVA